MNYYTGQKLGTWARAEIFAMYRPLLIKYSLVNRRFDEDLYQELAVELMKCIRYFRDVE